MATQLVQIKSVFANKIGKESYNKISKIHTDGEDILNYVYSMKNIPTLYLLRLSKLTKFQDQSKGKLKNGKNRKTCKYSK